MYIKYRYGRPWAAMALMVDGGYPTPDEAMRAWLDGDGPALPNINGMTWQELNECTGIGRSRSQAIVDYRDRNGFVYENPEDLRKARNIGPKVAAMVAGKVRFGK